MPRGSCRQLFQVRCWCRGRDADFGGAMDGDGFKTVAAAVSGDSNTCRWPLAATARTFARFSLLWSIISVNGYILAAVIIASGIHVHGAQYWHIRNWGIKHAH
jgi:hypothetical protein